MLDLLAAISFSIFFSILSSGASQTVTIPSIFSAILSLGQTHKQCILLAGLLTDLPQTFTLHTPIRQFLVYIFHASTVKKKENKEVNQYAGN